MTDNARALSDEIQELTRLALQQHAPSCDSRVHGEGRDDEIDTACNLCRCVDRVRKVMAGKTGINGEIAEAISNNVRDERHTMFLAWLEAEINNPDGFVEEQSAFERARDKFVELTRRP